MAICPVIMCGGAGTRLWPASRPSRPKQFIPLAGNRSLFQETAERVAPLAGDRGRMIVVGGAAHRASILEQLNDLDLTAQVLLEPQARDSAAAMAAAALWAQRDDPEAILVFVASDHHIPDHEAFRAAIGQAVDSARAGRVVTLGVAPTGPSQAYGYIKPQGRGLSAVDAFVEKPDRRQAEEYIKAGYLWNSGNFIVSGAILIEELQKHAPAVLAAAAAALPAKDDREARVQLLGEAFAESPRISIDYAVMEKTQRASVLEVDFAWSDLGTWDAIAGMGEGSTGVHVLEDAEGCLVRAPDGVMVAAVGVRNLGIVVEDDAVLVCDLSQSQDVKRIVERIKVVSPRHLDFRLPEPEPFAADAARFADWLRLKALPVWSTLGQSPNGAFAEVLTLDGRSLDLPRRARVQARQIQVFASAGQLGWRGPWREVVRRGLDRLYAEYLRPDGLCRTLLTKNGEPLDETAMLYDQAFVLFALATARSAGIEDASLELRAITLRERLLAEAPASGGLVEAGDHPYQSNAHMHLLEACLAWEEADGDDHWRKLADRVVNLALTRFIDPVGGFVREYFDADWAPAPGEAGRLVEPGHQFEWAWLLARHGRARGDEASLAAAQSSYAFGRRGVSDRPVIALDALNDDGSVRSRRARLWPQTEWLKASLILGETADEDQREALFADAESALRALWLYLTPEGLWRDKHLPRGGFLDEPAPATSLYHITAAFAQLRDTQRSAGLRDVVDLTLS